MERLLLVWDELDEWMALGWHALGGLRDLLLLK
jgi:hypothetical protein